MSSPRGQISRLVSALVVPSGCLEGKGVKIGKTYDFTFIMHDQKRHPDTSG